MPGPRVHWVNAALMVVSAALALAFPLQLMVAAYAVLGPAHYLTEISWLHKRGYFTRGRFDFLALGLVALVLFTRPQRPELIWLAVGAAAVTAFLSGIWPRLAGFALLAALAALLPFIGLFWSVMIPTVVHVYLFTGLFLLAGALKEKSRPGLVSFCVFVLCGAAFFLYHPHGGHYVMDEALKHRLGYFMIVQGSLAARFHMAPGFETTLAVMGFLSYAYTYHYLNWFSKVEIIRWHEVGGRTLAALGGIYAVLLGLFAYDYDLGFAASTFLSLLHVVLELPLDWRTAGSVLAGRDG